jgi:RNA polymerase sigma-70 factor (ECF subfamily)
MDDAELIRRFTSSGDEDAFQAIVQRHRVRIAGIVSAILGADDRAHIDDVAQDVFIKCAETLASFRFESAFATWLYRLAYNIAIDARRSARARRERERRFSESLRHRPGHHESVRDAVDRLPDVYRFVIHAHYWLGHTTSEIAEMLGVADGTVKSYLFRARAILGRKIGDK